MGLLQLASELVRNNRKEWCSHTTTNNNNACMSLSDNF